MFDVAVIGAGPSGSLAALLLARRGWSVKLIEQHRFPRDKACGECLSPLALEVLARASLVERLAAMRPTVLTRAAIHSADGKTVQLQMPRPMWGISRSALDQCLLRAAGESGVTVVQPARCEGISIQPRLSLRIRDLTTNRITTCHPAHVLLADGKGALMPTPPPQARDFGIKAHIADLDAPGDTIELFGCAGLYGGLAAIEGGRWNAAFSVPAGLLRSYSGNIERLFAALSEYHSVLRRRLHGARRVTNWLSAPLPRFAGTNHWPAGVIPIGNAAAALEPIGGEGIGLALRSAELAVESVIAAAGSRVVKPIDLGIAYNRLWRSRRTACRAAALVISHPRAHGALLPLLARLPQAARLALHLLGK